MLVTRLLLRRPPRIRVRVPSLGRRLRHDGLEPHKEYFQNPSQFPSASQTTQIAQSPIAIPQPAIPHQPTSAPGAKQPGTIRRIVRGAIIINVFFLLGWAFGTALITWEYIQPAPEADSDEHQELQEDIEDAIETSSIADNLRDNEWIEEALIKPSAHATGAPRSDQQLVTDTLSGVQGVTMKLFRHPTQPTAMLLFFAGFGIEGWPDTVHGGAISTMLLEAFDRTLQPMMREEGLRYAPIGHDTCRVNFLKPVRPGEVYAAMVLLTQGGVGQDRDNGDCYMVKTAQVFLMNIDSIPTMWSEPAPQNPGATIVNIENPDGSIHAIASMDVFMSSDRMLREDKETAQDYQKRFQEEVERIQDKWVKMTDLERHAQKLGIPPPDVKK